MIYESHDEISEKLLAVIAQLEECQDAKNKKDEYKCACDNLKTAVSFLNVRKSNQGA